MYVFIFQLFMSFQFNDSLTLKRINLLLLLLVFFFEGEGHESINPLSLSHRKVKVCSYTDLGLHFGHYFDCLKF